MSTQAHVQRMLGSLFLLLLLLVAAGPRPTAAQGVTSPWRHVGAVGKAPCVDPTEPDTLLWEEQGAIVRASWTTSARRVLHAGPLTLCAPNGLIFSTHADGSHWRMTVRDPSPRQVSRVPTHVGNDGTLLVYAREGRQLYASADGGLSWAERALPFAGSVDSLAISNADSRAIYISVIAPQERAAIHAGEEGRYSIYFSLDAGVSWVQRYQGTLRAWQPGHDASLVQLWPVAGHAVPVDVIGMSLPSGSSPTSRGYTAWVSVDGGRTMRMVGEASYHYGIIVELAYSDGWLVTYATRPAPNVPVFGRTDNGGQSWQTLALPGTSSPARPLTLSASAHGPLGMLLRYLVPGAPGEPASLWYAASAGEGWTQLLAEHSDEIFATPYVPATLFRVKDRQLYAAAFGEEGPARVAGAPRSGAPGSSFFPETQHNLGSPFKGYWERNGALAQFGYPRTEPFRELNPADGKIYLVQYFERNRFEYHPELAGTDYEVLLGLLGNQFTEGRRAAGEPPFQRVANPRDLELHYFPATGHTLGGAFSSYWEQNGGLAMYGYPISEEFLERNEDDGKTYIVQYFERARFEYHPENRGTRYEVLLGLLGNKLLRDKGWN